VTPDRITPDGKRRGGASSGDAAFQRELIGMYRPTGAGQPLALGVRAGAGFRLPMPRGCGANSGLARSSALGSFASSRPAPKSSVTEACPEIREASAPGAGVTSGTIVAI